MRRTKHRRRFHTERVIANRQRRCRREAPDWIRGLKREFSNGRLKHTNAYWDCGNPRCAICHWGKLEPARRDREKRRWRDEVDQELSLLEASR